MDLSPLYVLLLSLTLPRNLQKLGGQFLDKHWNDMFSHLPPSHPDCGQKEDKLWIGHIQVKLRTSGLNAHRPRRTHSPLKDHSFRDIACTNVGLRKRHFAFPGGQNEDKFWTGQILDKLWTKHISKVAHRPRPTHSPFKTHLVEDISCQMARPPLLRKINISKSAMAHSPWPILGPSTAHFVEDKILVWPWPIAHGPPTAHLRPI